MTSGFSSVTLWWLCLSLLLPFLTSLLATLYFFRPISYPLFICLEPFLSFLFCFTIICSNFQFLRGSSVLALSFPHFLFVSSSSLLIFYSSTFPCCHSTAFTSSRPLLTVYSNFLSLTEHLTLPGKITAPSASPPGLCLAPQDLVLQDGGRVAHLLHRGELLDHHLPHHHRQLPGRRPLAPPTTHQGHALLPRPQSFHQRLPQGLLQHQQHYQGHHCGLSIHCLRPMCPLQLDLLVPYLWLI